MSGIDVASASRRASNARATAQPYARRRPRRSTRLGHLHGDNDDNDDDEEANDDNDDADDDVLLNGALPERAVETAAAARGGLFSRLFSFFPLGSGSSKTPIVEEAVDDGKQDESMLSSDQDEDDKADQDTSQESLDTVLEVVVKSPVKETATLNGHAKSPPKHTRSLPSKRSSPTKAKAAETKPTSLPATSAGSSIFGNGTDKSKTLNIASADSEKESFAFQRVTGRRRNKPSSPRVTESPLAVIKKKKPISFEEYERLSTQLRNLVEPTPENALALTRSTLSNAFESRGTGESLVTQESGRDRRELSVAALPSVKRARPSEDLPIALPREDRLTRKPKPSRLLTGTKRDAASRSAYSAAVAEKILSTLNKIQTPLDKESQKPTPSTSLSWAKYQLALTNQDSAAQKHNEDASMDADDEDAPPTMTVPKVAWNPIAADVAPKATFATTNGSSYTFSQPTVVPHATTAKNAVSSSSFSSIEQPKAPTGTVQQKVTTQNGVERSVAVTTKQQMGQFAFTVPQPATSTGKPGDDDVAQYFFTPPPALREPPKRSPGQKTVTAKSSSTAPFSFMPSSPRVRPESLTKSVPLKAKSPEKLAAPALPLTSVQASASESNPLTRFMQTEPGSWRCPSCAVMNGAKHAKCPCCETSKPSSAGVLPTTTPLSTPAVTNPLARFTQMEPGSWKCPGCAVKNGAKYTKCPCCETNKPGGVATGSVLQGDSNSSTVSSSSSTGFTFGVTATDTKKTDSNANASTSGGFKFGGETQSASTSTSVGFSFGASSNASSSSAPAAGSFTFGTTTPTKPAEVAAKPSGGFTFGVSSSAPSESTPASNKRKQSNDGEQSVSEKKPATASAMQSAAGGFTFGVTAATSASASGASETEKPKPVGFTFGSTPSVSDTAKKTGFSFGSAEGVSAPLSSVPSFLSTASTTKSAGMEEKKDVAPFKFGASQEKKDTPSFTFASSSAKSATSPSHDVSKFADPKSSLAFDSSALTESKSAPLKATFGFTPSDSSVSTDKKPGFTFGGSAATGVTFGSKPSENATPSSKTFTFGNAEEKAPLGTSSSMTAASFGQPATSQTVTTGAPKTSFEFGSTTVAPKPSASFGTSVSTMSSTRTTSPTQPFTFGAGPTDGSAKKADAPAFTFGGSSQKPSSTFGGEKPPTSGFGQSQGFGSSASSSSGFGAASSTFVSTPSTSSGFGLTTTTGFGTATSAGFGAAASTGFGTATTAATSAGFGAPTSSGFGSSTSTGFGTSASTNFGAASSSTSFGATPVTTPSFGTTPATASGAPAFSFGASTPATSQPAFGFGAPTTSGAFNTPSTNTFGTPAQSTGFGSTPAAGGFGSNTASSFGMKSTQPFGSTPAPSPAFGVSGNGSGFGGNAFGSNAPVSGGFGVPTPTTSPAFGAPGSSFGTPNTSFGAPTNAFGATPSPASSAFGAPATPGFGAPPTPSFGAPPAGFGGTPSFGGAPQPVADGFNMGSAPPKRRILKAKSRPKRP